MALGENGHIVETQGNNVHYEDEIVIVGVAWGAFALLLLSISIFCHTLSK
jgi:hypothetical protein